MTINHIFLLISASKFAATRIFYRTALKPLGYTELLAPSDQLIGLGSDYPTSSSRLFLTSREVGLRIWQFRLRVRCSFPSQNVIDTLESGY
jgi:hypothetical protein